jgi:hypothetical protein
MSLVTTGEMQILSGDFGKVFDSFSYNRVITVHKEPLKTANPTATNCDGVFGFGENQQQPVYSYTPVNQKFPAIVRYKANINDPMKTELDAFFSKGGCSIMVRPDCHDYIMTNKTEKIELDGRAWFVVGVPRAKKFFLNDYYVFYLQNLG